MPSFSESTRVDNPLHPTSLVQSALYLGSVDGEPFRSEVTLLPTTRKVEWNGRQIEVLESQYFAYLAGRIQEVAIDWYAQADDGSVWYFGEDVFNYDDGVLANTHGTWLAGRDGPAAMIMPGSPQVGNVYRPENIPGLVFEEVTVRSTGVTVDGPTGPVAGAIVVRELHMDGSTEDKIFAPGYGEFSTGDGVDLEAMALAVPTDARSEPVPSGLSSLSNGAYRLYDAASEGDAVAAAAVLEEMSSAWERLGTTDLPPRLQAQMSEAMGALEESVALADLDGLLQAAIDAAQAALDLQLQYRPPAETDLARFGLMLRQLQIDAASGDGASVAGDATSLEWIRDRFAHTLAASDAGSIDGLLESLRAFAGGGDLSAAAEAAAQLREILIAIAPGS